LPGSPWLNRTSPDFSFLRMTRPCCQSRNFGGMPAKSGSEISSAAERISFDLSRGETSMRALGWKVIALVGQDTMHSPHCTQLELPIGLFKSKLMPALIP